METLRSVKQKKKKKKPLRKLIKDKYADIDKQYDIYITTAVG